MKEEVAPYSTRCQLKCNYKRLLSPQVIWTSTLHHKRWSQLSWNKTLTSSSSLEAQWKH
ncbi:unnamed protein product [Haemonchus placei]|uniref:Ovule protein n=1 Tax=Haemonchus placei TaxID=6290 RepID=A0A0N4WNL5_HAEPC|nr:unnamed protein product [Haemonchus placei]